MRWYNWKTIHINCLAIFSLVIVPVFFNSAKEANAAGAQIPYSFFLEHPYSITGLRGNVEFIDTDNDGWLIMNSYRADINLYQNLFGVYAKFPFAGVTDFGPNNESDYDFGNLSVGTKFVLLNLDNAVLTTGFEVFFPTAKNQLGSFAAQEYFRDVAAFADDAWTFKPYAAFGVSQGIFAFQANLDFDILTNAEKLNTVFDTGGDSTQLIIKYGGSASITPQLPLPFSTSFILELLLASSATFDNNITGAYLTPGVRFGGQIVSGGAGIEIPFGSNEVTDFANVGFVLDLIIRFGT
jgi:hypothetical protein